MYGYINQNVYALLTFFLPPRSFSDGVGEVTEHQVHSIAFGQVREALCLCDVVLHLLQMG